MYYVAASFSFLYVCYLFGFVGETFDGHYVWRGGWLVFIIRLHLGVGVKAALAIIFFVSFSWCLLYFISLFLL